MNHPYGTPRARHAPCGPSVAPLDRATAYAMSSAEEVRRYGTGEVAGDFYQRVSHANVRAFEAGVAELEGAEGAVAFASGIAAMSAAILGHCAAEDRVVIVDEIYGGTSNLARHDLPRFGMRVDRVSSLAPGALEAALAEPARMVVFETPINPTLRIVEIERVVALARTAGALAVVDSTFAPPPLQRAIERGVDLVVHSATKYLGGHSDVLAGVVAGRHAHLEAVAAWRTRTGAMLAPDPAWLLCRSLATHAVRLREQGRVARSLAQRLWRERADLGLVDVSHPGLEHHPDHALAARQMDGDLGLLSLVLADGPAAVRCFDALGVVARAPSLGGVESVASLPAATTHAHLTAAQRAAAGIPEGLVRVSVGLEGEEVLWQDLVSSLAAAQG